MGYFPKSRLGHLKKKSVFLLTLLKLCYNVYSDHKHQPVILIAKNLIFTTGINVSEIKYITNFITNTR